MQALKYDVGCCSAAVMGGIALCAAITSNAYLMSSRIILQSVANLPLFVILHTFIILMGGCMCMYVRVFDVY